jgi:hypothetical protein
VNLLYLSKPKRSLWVPHVGCPPWRCGFAGAHPLRKRFGCSFEARLAMLDLNPKFVQVPSEIFRISLADFGNPLLAAVSLIFVEREYAVTQNPTQFTLRSAPQCQVENGVR